MPPLRRSPSYSARVGEVSALCLPLPPPRNDEHVSRPREATHMTPSTTRASHRLGARLKHASSLAAAGPFSLVEYTQLDKPGFKTVYARGDPRCTAHS